ncbi:MAG: hypothetical protein Q9169_005579 [Polycauliona sp. 2 TL-2023]
MRASLTSIVIVVGSVLSNISAQAVPGLEISPRLRDAQYRQQKPMMNIPIPGFSGGKDSSAGNGDVIISDVIGSDRVINIFAGFTRDVDAISKRLNDDSQNTTVLAPLNSEIQKLPRKPWEDPEDYDSLGTSAYEGSAGEDRAHKNLRRFVEAHVIPASPWKEGEKVKSMGGEEVWWENRDGTRRVCPARRYRGIEYRQQGIKRRSLDSQGSHELRMSSGHHYNQISFCQLRLGSICQHRKMNPQNGNGWPPASAQGPPSANNEHHVPGHQRHMGSFPSSHALGQGGPPQLGPQNLLPQSAPFFPNSAGGHTMPMQMGPTSPHSRMQQPPLQQPQQQHQQSPPSLQHQAGRGTSYSLPALGPTLQHQQSPHAPIAVDREREREHERGREIEMEMDRQRQREMAQRDYEREMELHQHAQRESDSSPRGNHSSTIPLQQPTPSRGQGTLHGPHGILAHLNGGGVSNAQPNAINEPVSAFSSNAPPAGESSPRSFIQHPVQSLPHQQLLGGFSQAVNPQQLPNGMAALTQGQQPILNDALSYLDQVKVRFVEHPDVYNRFLDIMKDFKSQTIDTPGVIERVSCLFAGHPELIQGFNTFLPPGYRIECGTRDDPNTIRVTMPTGTTVSQMPSIINRHNEGLLGLAAAESLGSAPRHTPYDEYQADGEMHASQQDRIDGPLENTFATNGRLGVPTFFPPQELPGASNNGYARDDAEAAALAHQQEQRGVSHLSHAVSAAATNGAASRHMPARMSPTGELIKSQNQTSLVTAPAPSLTPEPEKRGPVEFNHAIGYVNKIKNRYSTQPDVYKQFLEILQTYQRDLKPIQDVYSQVTQLFSSDPDLLEDFKQFLPESAAQAKAQAAAARQATEDATMLSHVRGEAAYINGMTANQSQTPKPEMRMPPLGNFAPPPSVGKDNKKRRGGAGSQITGGAAAVDSSNSINHGKTSNMRGAPSNKRAKLDQQKAVAPEVPPISPTLVPSLPQPMLPAALPTTTAEETAFFDRVRKYINNKQVYNEFLKLCNLFTQELLDKNMLIHKAFNYIGANTDLMNWFKGFAQYNGVDEIVENRPKSGGDKVVLSSCRGLGPSYRLLPKRERQRLCSGRDEMCQQVLNDEWVSHPTWASEDSGFIAHRKNVFEDAIHRIEEERHDYDFNIEACLRTIQLIEPIVQQLKLMSDEERAVYTLPPGLGGQSETIYQRVIKKIYGRISGQQVIDDLYCNPIGVLPIVLGRLRQKVEEWKAGMREWEKVWREQTHKMFWKSLDHQGINTKAADKRQFQPKTLLSDIQVKYEEQRRLKAVSWKAPPRYQLAYEFEDLDVVQDACHLMLTHLHNVDSRNDEEKRRLENFFTTFIPTFFGLDQAAFQAHMVDIHDSSPPNEEIEDESVNEESNHGRPRRAANGRKNNLLRGVLERSKVNPGANGRDSKESTPDISSVDEDGVASSEAPPEQPAHFDIMDHRWMEHPTVGETDPKAPYARNTYNLYASLNIYCFFRMFQTLYERLLNIKNFEQRVHEDVARSSAPKPAHELNLIHKKPLEYFEDISASANYYQQIVSMCEEVMKQKTDMSHLEETLRRFYMPKGWQLYGFDKMLGSTTRFAMQILVSDNKDKSLDIVNLFYHDRSREVTTHDAEIIYRKQVDKLTKDADIFRITFAPRSRKATVAVFKKDDPTFSIDAMEASKQWAYYISSFGMREATEGVPAEKMQWPYLRRNLPPKHLTEEQLNKSYLPAWNDEGLIARINPETYRISFNDAWTADRWLHRPQVQRRGLKTMTEGTKERKQKMHAKFESNPAWIKGMSQGEVDRLKEEFQRSIAQGFPNKETGHDEAAEDKHQAHDETMNGA